MDGQVGRVDGDPGRDKLNPKIIWLASYPKSGSTWVRLWLNAFVTRMPLDVNTVWQFCMGDHHRQHFQNVCVRPVTELEDWELVYLRPAMLMSLLSLNNPIDACFKTHHANVRVEGIPLIPPKLTKRALYLVRDPRDVCCSYAAHVGKTIDETIDLMEHSGHTGEHRDGTHDFIMNWSYHVETWKQATLFPVTIIRYEDLFDRQHWRNVLAGLGVADFEQANFDFAHEETKFEKLQNTESEKGFREASHHCKFFRHGRVGKWKDILNDAQVARIEEEHGEMMEAMGYEKSVVSV